MGLLSVDISQLFFHARKIKSILFKKSILVLLRSCHFKNFPIFFISPKSDYNRHAYVLYTGNGQ